MTANTKLLEIVKKILKINTEEDWQEQRALTSPVADAEDGGLGLVPPTNPSMLFLVDKYQSSCDHSWESCLDLGEQDIKTAFIERHGHIECHHDWMSAMVQEVIGGLHHDIGALGRGGLLLISHLQGSTGQHVTPQG